jgi:nicotinamide-nucleotide adenylyltransferase
VKKRYRKAFIIGRFQPFHKGHLFLIKEALRVSDKAVIGIGSANIIDHDNPYPLMERLETIKQALKDAKLEKYIEKIVTIDDVPDDSKWLELALENVVGADIIVSNNSWVNGIFEKAGFSILSIPYYKRHIYEGRKIRARLRRQGLLH